MFLNHYPNYYTNSFYQGPGVYGRVGVFNGRESVVTINRSLPYNYNYNYYNQINNNKIIASTHAISRGEFQKPSTPTPLKVNPNDLLLQIQTSKLPPKTRPRSRAKVTNSTASINIKSNQSRTAIDKSTSTTNLKKNKAEINKIDKSTQTNINIIGLKREQKPPIPPTIISNSVKREEIKKKFLKKYSSSASSPISRPLSITSEFSTVSTNSTTASTNITKLKFLGVTRCDPILYRNQYESSLISSKNIPEYLSQIINSRAINANNSLRSPYFKMLDSNGKIFT